MSLRLIGSDHRDDYIGQRIERALEEDDFVLVEGHHPDDLEEFFYDTAFLDEGEEFEQEKETEEHAVHETVEEGNVVYLDEGLKGFADTTEDLTREYMSAIESIKEADDPEELNQDDLFYLISMSINDDKSYDVHFGHPDFSPGEAVESYLGSLYEQRDESEIEENDMREIEQIRDRVNEVYDWNEFRETSAELFIRRPELQEREEYWKEKIDIASEEYDEDSLVVVVGSLHAMEIEGNLRDKLSEDYEIEVVPLSSYSNLD
ncbi:MAG: hypothetical protein ABEK16_06415 [Candidatus Nanohalobium sp.]